MKGHHALIFLGHRPKRLASVSRITFMPEDNFNILRVSSMLPFTLQIIAPAVHLTKSKYLKKATNSSLLTLPTFTAEKSLCLQVSKDVVQLKVNLIFLD